MTSMDDGIVIVGSGHAGVQAAASLRDEGFDGPVTLVGEEAELPYHKPPLSKAFIKDSQAQPQILRAESFYANARIELRLGARAQRIDLGARRLHLADGTALPFSRLVLATGSRPRLLSVPGTDLKGVLALRSLADARLIRDLAGRASDVVIVGGGFIGLEAAATLAAGGRKVTVIEAQPRLLGRVVAPGISAHVLERLAASGIRVLLGTGLDRLEGDGHVAAAVTSTGERIAAQLVLVGIGVVPDIELAQSAGLKIGNGIAVDPQMRSSEPQILAIGDGASFRHAATGTDVRLESVQNATDQAKLAARTLTGHEEPYASVPWFWSDIGDMKLQMVGLTSGSDQVVASGEPADNKFSLFHYRGGRLAAIESVNRPADHMLGRKMLSAGFSPDPGVVSEGGARQAFDAWQTGATKGAA